MSTAKRVLMVLTNAGSFPGGEDGSAGWYLPECAHPYARFVNAGFTIEFASPTGGVTTVCKASVDLTDAENKAFWENNDLIALTQNTKVLSECIETDYDILFFVGGFGVMFDFPLDASVQRLAREFHESDKIVGAVCHGPIAFAVSSSVARYSLYIYHYHLIDILI